MVGKGPTVGDQAFGDARGDFDPNSFTYRASNVSDACHRSPGSEIQLMEFVKDRTRESDREVSNEGSPLLSPISPYVRDDIDRGRLEASSSFSNGDDDSKSIYYLFILTLAVGGLQIAWSVQMSSGSPFLLSLGMSKSLLAVVWMAGPLAGLFVQPYVGIRSDNCRLSWGKRRPFMAIGALGTALSFLALSWSRQIIQGFLALFRVGPESYSVQVCTLIWATIFVYLLNFTINIAEATIRAFIVDNAPTHQQEAASAWASRMTGVGYIVGYVSGYADLPKHFPWLGETQMQVLCAIAAFAICTTVAISSACVRERDPRLEGPPSAERQGVVAFFRQTYRAIWRLPPQIKRVYVAEFFNWIGWFGFLFYQTTYVGQIYCNPYFAANPDLSPAEVDKTWEEATRVATFALLIYAFTTLASSILLPFFVMPSYQSPSNELEHHHSQGDPLGAEPLAPPMALPTRPAAPVASPRLQRLLNSVQIPWLTLRRAWILSHFLFAACMFSTFFITTVRGATIQTAIVGIPWAVSLWAPWALMSAEISKQDAEMRRRGPDHPQGGTHDQAGVILGLHNVAGSAPQILATLIGSVIFEAIQKPRGVAGDNSTAWFMRFGGLAALLTAFFTWRIYEERDLAASSKEWTGYERIPKPLDEGDRS